NDFFVVTSLGGVVEEASDDAAAPGTTLASAFARDSRPKLMQLLLDGRSGPVGALLVTAAGETVEAYCCADDARLLLVAGTTPDDVRACCDRIDTLPQIGSLAKMILASIETDGRSIDMWAELARVNNELATAHRQLARSNAELRWLNEQKNQLLGMAAHDLRNPLAAVLAYSAFLLEDAAVLSADHLDMVTTIRLSAETMLELVEDVLDFSAIESGVVRLELVELSVDALLSDVIEGCRFVAARKDTPIAKAVDPDTPKIVADRRKMGQVLNNLVTNAIKFSHRKAHIKVTAGPTDDGGVWMSVTDFGVGMDSDEIAKLFKPFARVGPIPTGDESSTGLGLAIVSRIVSAHGGKIEVQSRQGSGSTFTVVLPGNRSLTTGADAASNAPHANA
ncbi:MAG: HAMP domain-containing sensor histidine kinase, partial [Thermoanaerobaculia bacterium]